MPTSNGQVSSRDIRQQAVRTLHLDDDSVTTAKIPDLAVTFPDKIDDPFWVDLFEEEVFFNETVTTTETSFATITVTFPAWVNNASVLAIGHFQLTNTSGADVLMSAFVEFDSQQVGRGDHEAVNNQTQNLVASGTFFVGGVAGASLDVDLVVQISTGTNTSNHGYLRGLAIGTR